MFTQAFESKSGIANKFKSTERTRNFVNLIRSTSEVMAMNCEELEFRQRRRRMRDRCAKISLNIDQNVSRTRINIAGSQRTWSYEVNWVKFKVRGA